MPVLTGSQRASRSQGQNATLGLGGTAHGVGRVSAVPQAVSVGTGSSRLRQDVVLGVDEEAESPVLSDITTSDTIIGVVVVERDQGNTLSAPLGGAGQPGGASGTDNLTAIRTRNVGDFVAGTGVLTSTANKEDNTGNVYIVTWLDAAYAATDFVPVV
jgi:hypothetical protein